ncbi:MAG TPA: YbjN domain-containing protein [Kofleriaceae bacterium]|nr:YbjN domain-containing protein [Kofleriaceae bacterium]
MNPAEVATALVIEETLGDKGSYRKVDERLYVIKQGSSYVMINIVPWESDRALVRVVAQLVKGVRMSGDLALQLLNLNAQLRFGAFAFDPKDDLVLFIHSLLGGATLDAEELLAAVTDVALIADEYDDKIIKKFGGQTMRELLEEAALERLLEADPDAAWHGGSGGAQA